MSPLRRIRWIPALAAAGASLCALTAGEVAVGGRRRPPTERHVAAIRAVEGARAGAAARWAAVELREAEADLDAALLGWSRQQARAAAFRDFEPVADALWRAETAARRAERLARERAAAALAGAEEAIDRARALEAHALSLVAATALPHAERARLQRSRLRLREAEALAREQEPLLARERAEVAGREMREALGPALAAAERYTAREQVAEWRRWVDETRRFSRSTGRPAIVVVKEKNRLVLLGRGVPVRSYHADVGANALGTKLHLGDRATPEGRYRIVGKKDRGRSRYYRALLLDYPNRADRKRFAAARRDGRIPPGAAIGGLIEIHGEGGRGQNWTDGCVALANRDLDDLYPRVPIGTPVTIVGGDGRDGAFSDLLARVGDGGAEGRDSTPQRENAASRKDAKAKR